LEPIHGYEFLGDDVSRLLHRLLAALDAEVSRGAAIHVYIDDFVLMG